MFFFLLSAFVFFSFFNYSSCNYQNNIDKIIKTPLLVMHKEEYSYFLFKLGLCRCYQALVKNQQIVVGIQNLELR